MEVKVGVQQSARELVVESPQSPDEVTALVTAAVADGGLLTLVDDKGRRVLVPAAKLAYVEIDGTSRGRVGFGAA